MSRIDIGGGAADLEKNKWVSPAADKGDDVSPPRPTHPAAFIGNPAPLGLLAFGMTTCK